MNGNNIFNTILYVFERYEQAEDKNSKIDLEISFRSGVILMSYKVHILFG
jgi:hypothetical protein